MRRVSSDMMNNDMQYWLRRKEEDMAAMSSRINKQERLNSLRDDPLAAAHAVRYQSVVSRLERYEKNIFYTLDRARIAEGYMNQSMNIMQRIRELAVAGANGINTQEDTKAMAVEVNELLSELVNLANARGPDGDFLFAGEKARTEPFRTISGYISGGSESLITEVEYLGGVGSPSAEISEAAYLPMNLKGDAVFWAERQRVAGELDASSYRVLEAGSIFIDGEEIALKAGDTVQAIIARINESGAPVKASLDPARNSLVLEGTTAHRLRIEDGQGGRVLAELGILSGSGIPSDYASTARVSGGSLFDSVISLRNSLIKGDHIDIGGRDLGLIDAAMNNLGARLAEAGAMMERLETTAMRLNKEIPDTTALLAREMDLDYTQAITDLKMMEYTQTASLQMAGRVLPKTLLDFLR